MRSTRELSRWLAVGLFAAWAATGCAPKSNETTVAANDSTVKAAAPAPDSAAKDTTKAAAGDPAKLGTLPVKPKTPPPHIVVRHVLIGFQGTIPGKTVTRTKDEAEKLAAEILDRARKGEDFDALVAKYSDDNPPGLYGVANFGVKSDAAAGEFDRKGPRAFVPGFTDVAFDLSVGNIGMAPYQPDRASPHYSPFGWHIIKRIK